MLEVLTSGNYSRLCADIQFSRSMGYYIIQVLTTIFIYFLVSIESYANYFDMISITGYQFYIKTNHSYS